MEENSANLKKNRWKFDHYEFNHDKTPFSLLLSLLHAYKNDTLDS